MFNRWSKSTSESRNPLIASWLSGSAFALSNNTLEFYSDCERRGGLVKTHVWGLPVYIVTDPLLIEEVLVRKH